MEPTPTPTPQSANEATTHQKMAFMKANRQSIGSTPKNTGPLNDTPRAQMNAKNTASSILPKGMGGKRMSVGATPTNTKTLSPLKDPCLKPFPTDLLNAKNIQQFYAGGEIIKDGVKIKLKNPNAALLASALKDNRTGTMFRPSRTLAFMGSVPMPIGTVCKYKNQDFNGIEVDFIFQKE